MPEPAMPEPANPRPWTHYRAVVAALARDRSDDDPELLSARRSLSESMRADRVAGHVAEIVAAAPELTPDQLARLAVLLRPGADRVAAGLATEPQAGEPLGAA